MASIRFDTHRIEGEVEIVPVIDDVDLVTRVSEFERRAQMEPAGGYGGLFPSRFRFGPANVHYFGGGFGEQGRMPVLGCACGEWGCWPLWTSVVATDERVTWSRFEQPFRPDRDYGGLGPLDFDRAEYEIAVTALEADWATP